MLLAMPHLTATPCVPAAIEETPAFGVQAQEAEALAVEAGAADKGTVGRGNNEHEVSLE